MNPRIYENIGKTQTPDARGLMKLSDWLRDILGVCPQCNISKTQFKGSALLVNKQHTCNFSGLTSRKWASQRAHRWLTVLNHLRRLYRVPEILATVLKTMKIGIRKVLQSLINMITSSAGGDSDDNDDAGDSDSDVSYGVLGIPTILKSPKKPGKEPENEPVKLDDADDDDDVDPPDPPKKEAKQTPHLPVMKKPSTAVKTSIVHDTIGGAFSM